MGGVPDDRLDADIKEMLDTFEGPASPRPRPSRDRRHSQRARAAVAAGSVFIAGGVLGIWAFGRDEPRRAALMPGSGCSELRIQGRRYLARKVSPALLVRSRPLGREAFAVCRGRTIRDAHVLRLSGIDPMVAVARAAAPELVYVAIQSRCTRASGEANLVGCLARPSR